MHGPLRPLSLSKRRNEKEKEQEHETRNKLNIKKNIPNAITLGNLLCGCLAITYTFEGDLVRASYLVGIALVLDFFDGFVARMLKVSSPIGKDLDSLADMVTFGVVPGMMLLQLINSAIAQAYFFGEPAARGWTIYPPLSALPEMMPGTGASPLFYLRYIGLVVTVFSCIRLAKFNNDTRQSDSFIGLPTPANAMVICSIPLIAEFQPGSAGFAMQPVVLCVAACVLSLLLVAELPLFALKFKGFSWADKQNRLRFVFLGLCLILLLSLQFVAIPIIILLYILLSIVNNIFLKKQV